MTRFRLCGVPVACLAVLWLEWRVWSGRAILVIKGFKMGFRRLRKLPKPIKTTVGIPDEGSGWTITDTKAIVAWWLTMTQPRCCP